jgi:hypothetical protein
MNPITYSRTINESPDIMALDSKTSLRLDINVFGILMFIAGTMFLVDFWFGLSMLTSAFVVGVIVNSRVKELRLQ